MAENFNILRNTYLGIEGDESKIESHQLMRLSKGYRDSQSINETLVCIWNQNFISH